MAQPKKEIEHQVVSLDIRRARASRRALYCSSATGQQGQVMPPMRDNQESMELVIFSINYLLECTVDRRVAIFSLPSEPFFDCQ